ncbi:insulinase family protein [Spirulina subsalsa FACHB-351]|uniref:Insulinase family protein n=1 Tax=Spirulina subsalsa FACHB-351 TaxID=234711 RepID=A0ABT3L0Q2_9CYAN|nr:pitrilysin family protein [Spirulina subsalsa]MCW6035077.1 insulinase family protein [Spirulina subsalsa FACHB-351]
MQTVQRTTLSNGITVLTVENRATDIIAARLFFRAGGRWEPLEKSGMSHLLAVLLTKGTHTLNSAEIAEKVESIGASLGADASTDYFVMSLKTVTADFGEILDLAAEILRSPSFPPNEFELEQHLTLQSIHSQKERPFNLAFQQLRSAMYPNHPYGVSILGTEETVTQLTPADLHQYHQTYFRPDNLVVSLSGCIDHEQAINLIEQTLGDWPAPSHPLPTLELPPLSSHPQTDKLPQESQQSIIMLGYLGPSVYKREDYATLKLLNTYLGNGLSSRLFVELREKRGLAYDVSAFYPTRLEPSQFVVYMGTAPDNTPVAIAGLEQEVKLLWEAPLAEEELQSAKNKLLGQYALGKQTNAEIAQILGWYETISVGIEFDDDFQAVVQQITPQQAQNVAQRYLSTDPYISLVGPAQALELAS